MKEKETKLISIMEADETLKVQALQEAGRILREGGLVAFPTETVYGLGGDALNAESARKIYEAKGRPCDNPLIVHIADKESLPYIAADISMEAAKLAEVFWPGPLTMILPKAEVVPYETTGGLDTVAVRMPSHPAALDFIRAAGGYVAAPSANTSGKPSPTLAAYVAEDMDGRIDMILDGGQVGIGIESTIVDLTVTPPQILRPGYITKAMLEQVLGEVTVDATILQSQEDCGQAPKAPGMKYRHYAPAGDLLIVKGNPECVAAYINRRAAEDMAAGETVGIIATKEQLESYHADVIKSVGSREDEEAIARNLYAILREFDDEKVTKIYSESFDSQGLGQAIMNRLLKAAGHHVKDLTKETV